MNHAPAATPDTARLLRAGLPALLLALLPIAPAVAHPSVGIVAAPDGTLYYSDLEQVWQVRPDGERRVAVPNVHTHELHLDTQGRLFGEHLWYEGETTDRWGHRVWRRDPDGTLAEVIPPTEGFLTGYSFVRDRDGTMYWAERGERTVIRKRLPDGRIVDHVRSGFEDVRWMTATAAGDLYLVDGCDVERVTSRGVLLILARDLCERSLPQSPIAGGRHNLMGLWTDPAGNVYVAVYGGRQVKRVSPRGEVEVVARTPSRSWSPTGGTCAPDGTLWLLENSLDNRVRVRAVRGARCGDGR